MICAPEPEQKLPRNLKREISRVLRTSAIKGKVHKEPACITIRMENPDPNDVRYLGRVAAAAGYMMGVEL